MSFNDAVVEKERAVCRKRESCYSRRLRTSSWRGYIFTRYYFYIANLSMVLHSSFILHKVFISLSNFDLKQRWESICWNSAAHIMDTKPIFQSPLKQIQRYGHGRALTQANVTTFTLRNTNPFLHSIEIMKRRKLRFDTNIAGAGGELKLIAPLVA